MSDPNARSCVTRALFLLPYVAFSCYGATAPVILLSLIDGFLKGNESLIMYQRRSPRVFYRERKPTDSLTHPITQSLHPTISLTHHLTESPLTRSWIHSFTHPLSYPLPHPPTHPLTHVLTHVLTYPHSLTHSQKTPHTHSTYPPTPHTRSCTVVPTPCLSGL